VLLGIVIESVLKQPFNTSLHSQLFKPLYGNSQNSDVADLSAPICPSSGKGLALSVDHLARLCEVFLSDHAIIPALAPQVAKEALAIQAPMPGWTPQIKGSCFGWRYYGNGWYGHSGLNDKRLSYIRINPTIKMLVCLTVKSETGSHTLLPSLLFKSIFPELAINPEHKLPITPTKAAVEDSCVLGIYGCSYHKYSIYQDKNRLKLDILALNLAEMTGAFQAAHSCFLYPSENNIFYLSKPWKGVAFVQAVHDEDDLMFYLWDHDKAWPKL
jgi:hypothetical protein